MNYNIKKIFYSFVLFVFYSNLTFFQVKASEEIYLGNKEAKITVIEYASMTCSHCADFHKNIFPKIKEEYIDPNKIKFVYRDFPLDKQALFASILAKCAPKEKYFDFVKLILSNQNKWISRDDAFIGNLKNLGKLGGLTEKKIDVCFKSEEMVDKVIENRTFAEEKYNINSTPSFIINEKKYTALSYEQFENIFESLIN